jgi:hypothetical protein
MAPKGKGGEGSVLDGLKNIYGELANLNLAPDAQQHQQFLQGLQNGIQKYLQMQAQRQAQQMAQMQQMQARNLGAGQVNPQMGGPQMGGAPRPGMPPGQPGGPPSQGSPGMQMPNPEELQRVLATQGQGG